MARDDRDMESRNLVQSMNELNFRYNNSRRVWSPPTDLYETAEAMVVVVEAAGMSEDDFSITFIHETLFIKGVRSEPCEKLSYRQMEIAYGEFSTEVRIDQLVERQAIDAKYEAGLLKVILPKTHAPR